MALGALPAQDAELVQIVDAALADSARRSGPWLVCRVGCTQCCHGVFPISQLDAARLRFGLTQLQRLEPGRAAAVVSRAKEAVKRLTAGFPGDPTTGILAEGEEAEEQFADFANEEPCPALSPESGECELYRWRPMTCRTFGPPVRSGPEEGLAVCELCYEGASAEQISACELDTQASDALETSLIGRVEKITDVKGSTLVAFCLIDIDKKWKSGRV